MSTTKTIKVPPQLYREAQITLSQSGTAEGSLSMSISSDEPYRRYDWWNDEEYYEVIDHSPGAIDENRLKTGLPVLFNHDRDQHLATAKRYEIDGNKCTLHDLAWSSSEFAQTKKRDAENGVLTTTSVGYRILDEGECIGAKDGIPIYKFKVEIFEGSLVTIPADISVGVGRQRADKPTSEPREITVRQKKAIDLTQEGGNKATLTMTAEQIEALQKELTDTKAELATAKETAEKAAKDLSDAQHKALADVEAEKQKAADAAKAEKERQGGLAKRAAELATIHKKDFSKALADHVISGKSVADFDAFILTKGFEGSPLPTGGGSAENKKSLKRDEFIKLSVAEQAAHVRSGGKITD